MVTTRPSRPTIAPTIVVSKVVAVFWVYCHCSGTSPTRRSAADTERQQDAGEAAQHRQHPQAAPDVLPDAEPRGPTEHRAPLARRPRRPSGSASTWSSCRAACFTPPRASAAASGARPALVVQGLADTDDRRPEVLRVQRTGGLGPRRGQRASRSSRATTLGRETLQAPRRSSREAGQQRGHQVPPEPSGLRQRQVEGRALVRRRDWRRRQSAMTTPRSDEREQQPTAARRTCRRLGRVRRSGRSRPSPTRRPRRTPGPPRTSTPARSRPRSARPRRLGLGLLGRLLRGRLAVGSVVGVGVPSVRRAAPPRSRSSERRAAETVGTLAVSVRLAVPCGSAAPRRRPRSRPRRAAGARRRRSRRQVGSVRPRPRERSARRSAMD